MIDMNGKTITNLGSGQTPTDAVRKKYVNEKFLKRGGPVDTQNNLIKNVLAPVDESNAATKGYVDSKSVGESDLDMNGNLIKNVRWPEEDHDVVNRAYVYFVANSKLSLEGGIMQGQIDMREHRIRNVNTNPQNEDELVPKRWIEENFLNRHSPASTMARDLNMDTQHISYLGAPEQNHHAATKGYADMKLSLQGGDMQGGIGMAGNRIRHLGEPLHDNDALRLSSASEFYLKRDWSNWMLNDLSVGGFRVRGVANPREDQDGVNLKTLRDSEARVLQEATSAADTVVGDEANILNRDIRTKSLNLDPQGTATENFSIGGQHHIAGLPDPTLEHEAVNLRTLNREIRANNLLESLKYLRLHGENQMVSDLQMNDHKLIGLANAVRPTVGVNKKVLDEAVTSLMVQTNENLERIERSIAVINERIVTNTETVELKDTILNQKIDRIEQTFLQRITDLELQLRKLQE